MVSWYAKSIFQNAEGPVRPSPSRGLALLARGTTIYGCGEYEKVVQGVFENYVNMQFKDLKLENVTRSLDWFTSFSRRFVTVRSTP